VFSRYFYDLGNTIRFGLLLEVVKVVLNIGSIYYSRKYLLTKTSILIIMHHSGYTLS